MKKTLSLLLLTTLVIFQAQAKVVVLNNVNTFAGQYQYFDLAYAACAGGDTILIQDTGVPYALSTSATAFSISKSLTVIGQGYAPIAQNALVSTLNFDLTIDAPPGAITVQLASLNLGTLYASAIRGQLTAQILRCYAGNVRTRGKAALLIRSNRIQQLDFFGESSGTVTATVENNVIGGLTSRATSGAAPTGLVFRNNVFLYTSGSSNPVTGSTFSGCIFLSNETLALDFPSNTFTHSCFYKFPSLPTTVTSNLTNKTYDPLFVPTAYQSGSAGLNSNFTLRTTSPALAGAEDGLQMGIYGGGNPFVDWGLPPVPQVISVSASGQTVTTGTTLKVNVKAKAFD
jgi:hypothetical protein